MFQSVSRHSSEQSIGHYSSMSNLFENHQLQRTQISTVTHAPFIQNSNRMAFSVDRNRKFSKRILSTPAIFKETCKLSAYKAALMTKTELSFPAFSLRFVDFEVQFCFRSKLSFHEKPCFNCPISQALIGSFLSSTRVQTDKIYANKLLVRVRLALRFGSCYCQKFAAEPLACVS